MKRYRFSYFLGQSFSGLWRNGVMTIASITVLMSCLIVMGSFALLILNIDVNLEKLGLLNEIVVFIDDSKTHDEAVLIEDDILNQCGDMIAELTFVSKEEALEEERQKYSEYTELYELVEGDNPLRDSYVIKYNDNNEVSNLEYKLGKIDGIAKINNRSDLAMMIERVKNGISVVLVWFMIILFVVSIFVIINTIKLAVHSRRSEITIMRYVGATNWFVILPFILEGIIIGLISSALAFIAEWVMYGYVIRMMDGSFDFLTIMSFDSIAYYVGLGFLAIGVITGIIGSTISTRKYLKA